MIEEQLALVKSLQLRVSSAKDFEELVTASLEIGEAFAKTFQDKRVDWNDAGYFLVLPGIVQKALDGSENILPQIGFASNTEFDESYEAAASGFEIPGKPELTHDIKGLVKGGFHGARIYARSKSAAAA